MIHSCMHATAATNMPASQAFNTQFLRVQQQKGVSQGAVRVSPRGDLCKYKM